MRHSTILTVMRSIKDTAKPWRLADEEQDFQHIRNMTDLASHSLPANRAPLSLAAKHAQVLYAAPSHSVCIIIIRGYRPHSHALLDLLLLLLLRVLLVDLHRGVVYQDLLLEVEVVLRLSRRQTHPQHVSIDTITDAPTTPQQGIPRSDDGELRTWGVTSSRHQQTNGLSP
jgi:hypothetical protein